MLPSSGFGSSLTTEVRTWRGRDMISRDTGYHGTPTRPSPEEKEAKGKNMSKNPTALA